MHKTCHSNPAEVHSWVMVYVHSLRCQSSLLCEHPHSLFSPPGCNAIVFKLMLFLKLCFKKCSQNNSCYHFKDSKSCYEPFSQFKSLLYLILHFFWFYPRKHTFNSVIQTAWNLVTVFKSLESTIGSCILLNVASDDETYQNFL